MVIYQRKDREGYEYQRTHYDNPFAGKAAEVSCPSKSVGNYSQRQTQYRPEVQQAMKKECGEQIEFAVWINQEARIVTFLEKEGYEKHTFRTQEDKMACVFALCESGYRVL